MRCERHSSTDNIAQVLDREFLVLVLL
jgi:hypothetical protein